MTWRGTLSLQASVEVSIKKLANFAVGVSKMNNNMINMNNNMNMCRSLL